MILTVTPNPLLERRLFFSSITPGGVNRSKSELYYAGGKGINVSRQLNKLGIKNTALTFIGGSNGKLFRKSLDDESINYISVNTKSETRYAAVTIDKSKKQLTSYFSPNSKIEVKEVDEFIYRMDKAIQNCSIVVFAGSSPTDYASNIFYEGIQLAQKNDKVAILDTYGKHLKKCYSLSPFAVHNNKAEIENSLGIEIDNDQKYHNLLNNIYQSGIKMGFITDGKNNVYSSKFDFHYKATPPKVEAVNSLGSGDAFVAGMAYGLERSFVYDDLLKFSIALGSLNTTSFEAANVDLKDAEKLSDKVKIEPIGKKMKLIDDSPNY